MQIIKLQDIDSTNEYMLHLTTQQPDWEGVVVSDFQSEGKGMGTNKWESEKGKNLLFSILIHPIWLQAKDQFLLSMAEAIALCNVLNKYVNDITIKWPNDIYWKDMKISGTRIDTNINGSGLADMIIGTGININQQKFLSNAPNPISLQQITGLVYDKNEILLDIISTFEYYYNMIKKGNHTPIIQYYHNNLYRRNGYHPYRDINGEFHARIVEVKTNGQLILERNNGVFSKYFFKEVEFCHDIKH